MAALQGPPTAVAWLERAGFIQRDENLTQVFQARLQVGSLAEASARIAASAAAVSRPAVSMS